MQTNPINFPKQNAPLGQGVKKGQWAPLTTLDCALGNDQVWQAYKNDLYPLVYDYAHKLLADGPVSEGVTAYAFRRLWENRQGLTEKDRVLGFLFMVARTRLTDILRLRTANRQNH